MHEAVPDAVGGAVVLGSGVAAALAVSEWGPVALCAAEGVAHALGLPLPVGVAAPVPEGGPDGDAAALGEAECVGVVQRNSEGSHRRLGAHAGAPSSSVHAGPAATPPGHHVPPAPQPAGATTAPCGSDAKVNAAEGAHSAGDSPWQDSDGACHWRPTSHRVAERGPE